MTNLVYTTILINFLNKDTEVFETVILGRRKAEDYGIGKKIITNAYYQ